MKNKRIWQLRNLRDKITGITPINNLYFVLHSTEEGQEYCVLKLIYQYEGSLGYTTSQFLSINNGDIIEVVLESKTLQTLHYENEYDYYNGYKMSYLVPVKEALPFLQMNDHGYIHNSLINHLSKKYNEKFGFPSQENIQMQL